MAEDPKLELSRARREALTRAIMELVEEHVTTLETTTCGGLGEAESFARAREHELPISDDPIPGGLSRVQEVLRAGVEASLPTSGAGYLAYVPGGGLLSSSLADLFSDTVNRFTGLASASPLFCRLEADVLAWLASEFGYGPAARGLLTSGGSMANFSAVVTARATLLGEAVDLRTATVYTSSQVHHSVERSVTLAGIPRSGLRVVEVDSKLRMNPTALEEMILADRARGRRPFLVVGSAGTTNTGAIDPLHAIADVCARHELWLHVDGAYGGAFVLCPEGKQRLAGIERADSIVFDPHKGMFLPYGTGCLLVKNGAHLRDAHRESAEYLEDFKHGDDQRIPSPTEYGPELSRDFRGLRLWLPLMVHGARPFREALTEKLSLAHALWEGLHHLQDLGHELTICESPQLSTVAFRRPPRPGETSEDTDRRNAELLQTINKSGRVFLSTTRLPVAGGSLLTLRACFLSFRTHAREVTALLEVLGACQVPAPSSELP
ncbi:MAG: pyridoxal phosphate-dependent decarboxylase family protein [Nannocystaceae bacterium]